MPLSLSSFCPRLGISTGVLCAKTNRSDQQKILHNSSYYLWAFKKKKFKFKGHKTAKLHPVLLLQISSTVWAEEAANSISTLSTMLLEESGYLPQSKNIFKKLKHVNIVYIIRSQICFENEGWWYPHLSLLTFFVCVCKTHFTQVNIIMK